MESGAHVPEGPLMHPPYTRSIWSTFFTAEAPYDRERSSFAHRRTPWSTLHVCEGPSSVWSTFFTLEGPWGSLKDLRVLRRTLKDLYFLECTVCVLPSLLGQCWTYRWMRRPGVQPSRSQQPERDHIWFGVRCSVIQSPKSKRGAERKYC